MHVFASKPGSYLGMGWLGWKGFQRNMGDIYINIHIQCTFADRSVSFCYTCHLPSHHIQESMRVLYMVAGEVASIAKTYRRISKCALNMCIDAYISHIPLESLSFQSSHTQVQACIMAAWVVDVFWHVVRKHLLTQECPRSVWGPLGTIPDLLGTVSDEFWQRIR